MEYKKIFEPGYIGNLEVPNRIVMPSMATAFADTDGRISQRQIDYYAARARGGAGLIIVEATKVERKFEPPTTPLLPFLDSDMFIGSLADLADAVHGFGAKIGVQLSAGIGRQKGGVTPEHPPFSASEIPAFFNPSITCRALTKDDIKEIVTAFGRAAERIALAGCDLIELHGHTGYMIDQFLCAAWNKRTDEYGGDLEGRMRFAIEIIESIRQRIGSDLPISFRLGVDHRIPGGRTEEESIAIAQRLESVGIDIINVDAGCIETMDLIFPPSYLGDACLSWAAAAVKKAVNIPVIAVGNITPEKGEMILQSGQADFIATGRGLIADSDWPRKTRQGLREEVRPCIRCNEQCVGRIYAKKTISCAVNPAVGKERYYQINRVDHSKKVLIIGGGPAGMEAARVASLRGHQVTLMEKEGTLGGQLRAAATSPFKKELTRMINWWVFQLDKLGVEVNRNTAATFETVAATRPDVIVAATGAIPIIPGIPGIDNENVVGIIEYHLKQKLVTGNNIVIIGGGLSGCDAALELALDGKRVTIVEMLPGVAPGVNMVTKKALIDKLSELEVQVLTNHRVKEFNSNGLIAENQEGKDVTLSADTMILAMGTKPDDSLVKTLQGVADQLFTIGDCSGIGKVGDAVKAGYVTGWQL